MKIEKRKPFRAVWVDENLKEIKTEHSCSDCYYDFVHPKAYPCSMCIMGEERKDMFKPKKGADDDND